jgi:hypothetical protein
VSLALFDTDDHPLTRITASAGGEWPFRVPALEKSVSTCISFAKPAVIDRETKQGEHEEVGCNKG